MSGVRADAVSDGGWAVALPGVRRVLRLWIWRRLKFGFGRFVRVVGGGFEGIKNRPPRKVDLLKN